MTFIRTMVHVDSVYLGVCLIDLRNGGSRKSLNREFLFHVEDISIVNFWFVLEILSSFLFEQIHILKFYYLCVHVRCMWAHACYDLYAEVRGQWCGVSSPLPPSPGF